MLLHHTCILFLIIVIFCLESLTPCLLLCVKCSVLSRTTRPPLTFVWARRIRDISCSQRWVSYNYILPCESFRTFVALWQIKKWWFTAWLLSWKRFVTFFVTKSPTLTGSFCVCHVWHILMTWCSGVSCSSTKPSSQSSVAKRLLYDKTRKNIYSPMLVQSLRLFVRSSVLNRNLAVLKHLLKNSCLDLYLMFCCSVLF